MGDVAVRSVKSQVDDVIQPRFDQLAELQSNVSQSRSVVDNKLHSISSGLEFIQESLAKLDQPVSLRGDPFIQLNSSQLGTSGRFSSIGLDFMLPASGPLFRYNI